MGDEEAHVLVGDLHRGRSVHPRHRDHVWKRRRANGWAQVEKRDVSSEPRGAPAGRREAEGGGGETGKFRELAGQAERTQGASSSEENKRKGREKKKKKTRLVPP